jgi:hypothetical protein
VRVPGRRENKERNPSGPSRAGTGRRRSGRRHAACLDDPCGAVIERLPVPSPARGSSAALGGSSGVSACRSIVPRRQGKRHHTASLCGNCDCRRFMPASPISARMPCISNVSGMSKNHAIAGAVLDCGFHEFRHQLQYKAAMGGGRIVVADRFFPSSRTCSACGCANPYVVQGVDVWTCIERDVVHERDSNAAITLEKLSLGEAGTTRGDMARLPACLRILASAEDEPRTLTRRTCAHV